MSSRSSGHLKASASLCLFFFFFLIVPTFCSVFGNTLYCSTRKKRNGWAVGCQLLGMKGIHRLACAILVHGLSTMRQFHEIVSAPIQIKYWSCLPKMSSFTRFIDQVSSLPELAGTKIKRLKLALDLDHRNLNPMNYYFFGTF